MYIDNRNYPGGPMAWFLASANEPSEVAFWASLFALTFMSDLLAVSIYIQFPYPVFLNMRSSGVAGLYGVLQES